MAFFLFSLLSPFGAPKTYIDKYEGVDFPNIQHPQKPEGKTTWHKSGEFSQYNKWDKDPNTDNEFAEEIRRHYAACVSYADAQVGKVLAELNAINNLLGSTTNNLVLSIVKLILFTF